MLVYQSLIAALLLFAVPVRAATYIVDPLGDDTNAGTSAAPWRTIQYAVSQAAAGDTMSIRAGTYVESVYLDHGGTEGNPLALIAAPGAVLISPDPAASTEAISTAPGVGFITLTGIEATGGFDETIFLRSGAHDVRIAGCNLHHNHTGIVTDSAYNLTVEGCALHDNFGSGLRLAGTTHDVVVRDTDSFRNADGPGCSSLVDGFATEPSTTGITFTNVRADDNGGDGFDLQGDQIVLNAIESTGNACTGIKLWQNAAVRNCLVAGNARGVGVTSWFGGSNVSIVNCTVTANAGVGLDLALPHIAGTGYTASVLNSIIAGDYKAIQFVSAASFSESHNLLFRTSLYDPVITRVGGRGYSDHDVNTARWARASGQGAGTLAVDPLFVDPAHGNFRVQPSSAAVGSGQDVGNTGALVNIGMYQQPEGPTNHAPWADPGRDRRGHINSKLRFHATGSGDPDGTPLTYSWDFGDGSASVDGFSASHIYRASGTYTVVLIVFDGALAGSSTCRVVIP